MRGPLAPPNQITCGWRQTDLGKAAGYSASTIFPLETNRRASIDVGMLRRVAHAVGIPKEVLGPRQLTIRDLRTARLCP